MVRPCKEGDIVVDTGNGVLCTFIKYKTKWPWVECRNPHDQVLSYRAATLRHATDGEKSVHKKAVDAYNVYTENGGEKPVLPKVARFANEGSGPDPAAMKKNTEVMRGLLKKGGYSGGNGGSAALDGDDVSVTLAFDQALSDNKCIEGRSRKHDRDDFRRQMGQAHMGFGERQLAAMLKDAGFRKVNVRPIEPGPDAKGPALLVATGEQ